MKSGYRAVDHRRETSRVSQCYQSIVRHTFHSDLCETGGRRHCTLQVRISPARYLLCCDDEYRSPEFLCLIYT
jgi:hypothetical protein